MEWSTDQPQLLQSNFTVNDNLEVYVIAPSKTPTVLYKEKNTHNPNIYQSAVKIPTVQKVVNTQGHDSKSSVTFNGNCVINNNNNRAMSKFIKNRKRRQHYYESSDSSDTDSCISLPNETLFEGDRNRSFGVYPNSCLPTDREHVSYLNRSIYLPTPKQLPNPRSENRAMYLPSSPKREARSSNIVEIYERASAPFTSYIVNNSSSKDSSGLRRQTSVSSSSSSGSISIGSMRNEMRDNEEVDWNNTNLFEVGVDSTDDELSNNDRLVMRSYVPYKVKAQEQFKAKQKNFKTEIRFRKKMIPLEEIVKLDLELIGELARARAEVPKKSASLIKFF